MVGGTLQLMRLGIAAFGGASVPDYFTGAVLGTAFAVISGNGAEYGIGLAVPVSLLMLQLDVVARFVTYFYYTGSIEPSTTCKLNESHG